MVVSAGLVAMLTAWETLTFQRHRTSKIPVGESREREKRAVGDWTGDKECDQHGDLRLRCVAVYVGLHRSI
jgi:hypothetical protein